MMTKSYSGSLTRTLLCSIALSLAFGYSAQLAFAGGTPLPPQSPAQRRKAAAVHATKGGEFQVLGEFRKAIREFKTAYRLVPKPEYLFDLAQAYRRNGDLKLALDKYELFLSVQRRGKLASKSRKFIKILKKAVASRGGPGRRGHAKCRRGQWLWGGSCSPTSTFTSMARRKSRMYFGTRKDCIPGFLNRSGTYCYVCPSGKYWNKGGSCTYSCPSGKNYSERKCKAGGGAGGPGRRGHESCQPGYFMYAGSCTPAAKFSSKAQRYSRIYFGSSKDCPTYFSNRTGNHCYVCPSGKYWNKGGSCTSNCAGGKNYSERKCNSGNPGGVGVAGGVAGGSRKGHGKCSRGQWLWGGSCSPTSTFTSMARRKSRMFFSTRKACPPAFLNRAGTYCYVCPSGQYWKTGGSCVSRCSGRINHKERKCTGSLGLLGGGVVGGGGYGTLGGRVVGGGGSGRPGGLLTGGSSRTPRRFGHGKCPAGQWEWGGSCDNASYYRKLSRRRSRIFFSKSKSCPPGLTYRSSTYCYVCPSGKFWSKGGSCASSCQSGGKNYSERSCGKGVPSTKPRGSSNTTQGYSVGRTGHTSCPVGKWKWGGSCDPASYFRKVARRQSRIFMGSGKTCVPGLSYRAGTYCYTCPKGKFWSKGGTCTSRCAGSKNYGERKCNGGVRSGGGSTARAGRRGHESCAPGKYKWGGKCDAPSYFHSLARRRSRIYFSAGKDCPPGLSYRSGTYCHVCPSGKYWNKGGSCTSSCAGGKNYSERKCR